MSVQITMSLTNIFQYISFSAPLLIVFFITLYSIMQNNLERGLIGDQTLIWIKKVTEGRREEGTYSSVSIGFFRNRVISLP